MVQDRRLLLFLLLVSLAGCTLGYLAMAYLYQFLVQ